MLSKNDPLNMYANEKGFIIPVMILCLMTIVIISMFSMVAVIVIMMYNAMSDDDSVFPKLKGKNRTEEESESGSENEPNESDSPNKNKFVPRRSNHIKINKLIDSLVNSNKMFFMIVIFLMACILLHATVTAIDSLTEAFSFIKGDTAAKTVTDGKQKKI